MWNKDFIKALLADQKELLSVKDVKLINVPMFDELGVTNMWPKMKDANDVMRYFPNKLEKGRLPERKYFWNVLNTVNTEYVTTLIDHANRERHTITNAKQEEQAIVITDEWAEKLLAIPFISCKCPYAR